MTTTPARRTWWRFLLMPLLLLAILIGWELLGPVARSAWRRLFPADEASDGTWYISQMHPWIVQPEPGTCPICGMDLTPINATDLGRIAIDPATVQNIGIRTCTVVAGPLLLDVRATGSVTWDPARVQVITARAQGWVKDLHVVSGDAVTAGSMLGTVAAPELIAAQHEWLAARTLDPATLSAAEGKLSWLGFSSEDLTALQQQGEVQPLLSLRASAAAIVSARMVDPGDEVGPDRPLLRLVDPSVVWVVASVFEEDLPAVEQAEAATLVLRDGRSLDAVVARIEPGLDPQTRAARVRLVVDNPDLALREGMVVTVNLRRNSAPVLHVPRGAVQGSPGNHHVFISQGQGRFEPRPVTMGRGGSDGEVEILQGLAAGDRVVVSGQFLLDSEARIQEGLRRMVLGDLATQPVAAPPASATGLAAAAASPARQVAAAAIATAAACFRGDLAKATSQGGALADAMQRWQDTDPHLLHRHPPLQELAGLARSLAQAQDLAAARSSLGRISTLLRDAYAELGPPPGPSIAIIVCGMFPAFPEGGVWFQDDATVINNPYSGESGRMPSCGQTAGTLGTR